MYDAARFWSKVRRAGPDDCWMWTACTNGRGYGTFNHGGKMLGAHRIAYALEYGEVPKGKCVCHHCDTPGCVNPSHLFIGSHADNSADMVLKGRHPKAILTYKDVLQIRAMRATGAASQEIAAKFGVSNTAATRAGSGRCWRCVTDMPGDMAKRGEITRGERHWRSRLTECDIVSMRQMHANGISNSDIAKQFGISLQHVRKIVNELIWRHVKC